MVSIKPPESYIHNDDEISLFVAGSIEMGTAPDWQNDFERFFRDLDVIILNPRRDDWDSNEPQVYENAYFKDQVNWELDNLEKADYIFLYLHPETISPISLLELGESSDKNIVVCCPQGYFRRGNIQIYCKRKGIRLIDNLYEAKQYMRSIINVEIKRRKAIG